MNETTLQDLTFQDLQQKADDIQKKLDKYEQNLLKLYNSEKGAESQETFAKYLMESISFYRQRYTKITHIIDCIVTRSIFNSDHVCSCVNDSPVQEDSAKEDVKPNSSVKKQTPAEELQAPVDEEHPSVQYEDCE